MNTFEINSYGKISTDEKSKDFYKMIFGGILFYISLFFAIKYTIDSYGFFVFLGLLLTLLYIVIFIITPINIYKTTLKVVKTIEFTDNRVLLTTRKEYILMKNEIIVEEVKRRFYGFGKQEKDGILIKSKDGQEYWIIEDFFNDYEQLKSLLIDDL